VLRGVEVLAPPWKSALQGGFKLAYFPAGSSTALQINKSSVDSLSTQIIS